MVHHYGHCGYGIMTAPGSAVTAANLVKDIFNGEQDASAGARARARL